MVSDGAAASALDSAAALRSASSSASASAKEGACALAKRVSLTASVTVALRDSSSRLDGKYREEKGGGLGEGGAEFDASD